MLYIELWLQFFISNQLIFKDDHKYWRAFVSRMKYSVWEESSLIGDEIAVFVVWFIN